MKYLNWANMFLKNQVKLRDEILYEQKLVLDRNQIDNDINYDGLKAIDRFDAIMKKSVEDALPVLKPNVYNGGRVLSASKLRPGVYNQNRYTPNKGSYRTLSQPKLPALPARGIYQPGRDRCSFSLLR